MDAWKYHLTFALAGRYKAGSTCRILGELPRLLSGNGLS